MDRRRLAVLVLAVSSGIGQPVPGQTERESRAANVRNPTSTLMWQGSAWSVSLDGRFLSFTDWKTGDLMVHDLETDEDRVVVAANNPKGELKVYAETSTISRDGNHAAYGRYDETLGRYELWITNLRGDAHPRRLYGAQDVRWLAPHDWSPDGEWVLVSLSFKNLTKQLALVSTSNGTVRPIKSGSWSGGIQAFFSPNGRLLAYNLPQNSSSARDIWVASVDGTKAALAVSHRGDDVVMGWSPDGKQLLFTTERSGGTALFRVEIVDGTPQGMPAPLKPDMGLAAPLGLTRNGVLFYVSRPGQREGSIQVANFDLESGGVNSPRDISPSAQENNVNPSWSHDGKYLAYVSMRGRRDELPLIVIRTAETGGLVREIQPKMLSSQLAGWVPDGSALFVTGTDLSGTNGTFRIDVDSGKVTFLLATPYAPGLSMPTMSLDGRTLYYWNSVDGGKQNVVIAHDLITGAEKEIIRRPFVGALLLSPDGRFLATATIDPPKNERLMLFVPLDGSAPREAMRIAAGVTGKDLWREGKGTRVSPASWTPDSRSVIARVLRETEGPSEMWRVSVTGEASRKLPAVLEPNVFAFRISPDGQRVAYRIKEFEPQVPQQVWKFENFLPPTSGK